MTRKQPSTSMEAYKMLHPDMLSRHHSMIMIALGRMGSGIAEEIAVAAGFKEKVQCHKRMSELERSQLIEKTGEKKLTSSGRPAFVYRIKRAVVAPSADQLALFV